MDNYRKQLAKRLRQIRGGASQLQYAKKLGVSQSSLNRMEMAQQNVTLDTIEKLCTRLRCSIQDLFNDEP